MPTGMTEGDWALVLEVFTACQSRRGDKGRDDRLFLEAMHFFTVENVAWRRLPERFGKWNSVWRRFSRLSESGVFEAFFEALAELSPSAHLVQMFDSTVVRAHVSAAGAKGGRTVRRSAARAVASPPRSTSRATSTASRSAFTSPAARRATAASSSCSSKSVPTSPRARR